MELDGPGASHLSEFLHEAFSILTSPPTSLPSFLTKNPRCGYPAKGNTLK